MSAPPVVVTRGQLPPHVQPIAVLTPNMTSTSVPAAPSAPPAPTKSKTTVTTTTKTTSTSSPSGASTTSSSTSSTSSSTSSSTAPPSSSPAADGSSSSSYIPIREAASKVHSSLANSNYSVVRLGVGIADSLSSTALSFVPQTVVTKVEALGNPLLDAADNQLGHAYDRLRPMGEAVANRVASVTSVFNRQVKEGMDSAQQFIMPASWFSEVDEVITAEGKKQVPVDKNDIVPLVQSFYNTAAYTFLSLARRGAVDKEKFVTSVKSELERVWTEKLRKPTEKFFDLAEKIYTDAGAKARDVTTTSLLESVKPQMGQGWEQDLLTSFPSDASSSQLVYLRALSVFTMLQSQLKAKTLQAADVEKKFIDGMKEKLGGMYTEGLEKNLKELIGAWTEKAQNKRQSLAENAWGRYQWTLLSAQQIFDRVLPPVIYDEEEKEEEKKEEAAPEAKEDVTLLGLASHVKERVGERGVVSNVTTASSNSVKESVQLAGKVVNKGVEVASNVASSAVQTAQSVVRPVVDPIMARVTPIVGPVVQPVVDRAVTVSQELNKQLAAQLASSIQLAKNKIEQLQQFVNSVSSQTRAGLITAAENTKTSLTNTATSAASTIQSSLPAPIAARVKDLQERLSSAVQYAEQLRQDGQLQQQITQLSLTYAEVARAIVSEQLHALQENLNAERLASLMEEAKQSVVQVIQHARKQLALEKGLDDEEVTEETTARAGGTTVNVQVKVKEEEKTNPRQVK